MVKKIVIGLLFVLCVIDVNAQEHKKKELDFIIMIDGDIKLTYALPEIRFKRNGVSETIITNYYPGNLSLEYVDYEKLIEDETVDIYIEFTYYEYIETEQRIYNYEIELKKPWLKDYYNILRVYNLDKKSNKGFVPLNNDKNYTFELSSPSHTFLRIKN